LEAMSAGCPVVSSDKSSIPEIAGDSAILVDPEDEKAICHAVVKVLTNKAFAFRLSNIGRVQASNFSWKLLLEKTLQIYENVLFK